MEHEISVNSEGLNSPVLLIDLENCPNQIHTLPNDLATYHQVVICYAQNSSKVPLNWLNPLATAIAANKLRIVQMERAGKNAADFGISFLAGALMQELPAETHFVVVSNDSDLDHTVHLLKMHGRSAERIGGNQSKERTETKSVIIEDESFADLTRLFCETLPSTKGRPRKMAALRNSIKSNLKVNSILAEKVIEELLAYGVIASEKNSLTYDDKALNRYLAREYDDLPF